MVTVHEAYNESPPPSWLRPTVERLLTSLNDQPIGNLGSVVLTNSAAIGDGKTQRVHGRKHERRDCLGFYHAAGRNERAWIEVVVDNIARRLPRPWDYLQFARDLHVANTLFHEMGHHLHATIGSAGRDHEAAAEDWRLRLTRIHIRKRYRYLIPLLRLSGALYRMLSRTRWFQRVTQGK